MSRNIGANNITEANLASLEVVILVHFAFTVPIYVHTGIGTITFSGDNYLGVGDLGTIGGMEESEQLSPAPIELTLSSTVSTHIAEALDSGNFGDTITIYQGYRNIDGTLVADPWILARGTFEYANITLSEEDNKVTIVMQHDIVRLEEKNGRRWSDEDQRNEYPNDTFLSFIAGINNQKLLWGGQVVQGDSNMGGPGNTNTPP